MINAEEFRKMSIEELLDFMTAYDDYVIACGDDRFERVPVCMSEYLDCEWALFRQEEEA